MTRLLNENPIVKTFMWETILNTYDDDLKLFLGVELRQIDYLK